jgi:hypothetical protein
LLDASIPVRELKKEVDRVLSAAVYRRLPSSRGQNSQGTKSFSVALKNLALLRYLTKKSVDAALWQSPFEGLEPSVIYERVAAAVETFQHLFVGLECERRLQGRSVEDVFPGYGAYRQLHPRFGR